MAFTVFKVFFSAGLIAFTSWLAGKKPELAGFIVALPLMTLLVLPFAQIEYQDPDTTIRFAQSILTAIPLTLTFFLPFLLAGRLDWPFWGLYLAGIACLTSSYFLHRLVMSWI